MAGTLIPVSASTSTLLADAPTYAAQAAASAAAAALSEAATAADVVSTNADAISTAADVVASAASAAAALVSEGNAATSEANAAASAAAAAASAATLNIAAPVATNYIRGNATNDGYESRTPAQTKADLAITGADVANTPAGNIAATTVQAAINELDTEKAALAGAAFTGTISATAMDNTPIGQTTPAPGAFTNLSATTGFDLGQTWQDVTASRAGGVTYTNTTGKPIVVSVFPTNSGSTGSTGVILTVNGIDIVANVGLNGIGPGNLAYGAVAKIPPGGTYRATIITATIARWSEFR